MSENQIVVIGLEQSKLIQISPEYFFCNPDQSKLIQISLFS
jgi:hypothetical protein